MPLRHSSTDFSKQVEASRPTETARRKRPSPSTRSRSGLRQSGTDSLCYHAQFSRYATKPSWLSRYGGFTIVLTAAASLIGAVIGGWYTAAILASIAFAECIAMTAQMRNDTKQRR